MRQLKNLCAIALLLTLCMACDTDVELCYSSHPHRSYIDFEYDWEPLQEETARRGEPAFDVPDSMRVIAYRRVNTLKYKMLVSARRKNNGGHIILPEYEIHPTSNGNTALWLRNGDYELVTYSGVPNVVYDEVDDFFTAKGMDLSDTKLRYQIAPQVDELIRTNPKMSRYRGWVDHNPYSGYLLGDLLCTGATTLSVPVAHNGSRVTCLFTPSKVLSQSVTMEFVIDPKEAGIVIDSVHAEMSGACAQIVLGSGAVGVETTGKVLFAPKPVATNTTQEGPVTVRGSFSVPGLIRSDSRTKMTGPGILQVEVFTHITDQVLGEDGHPLLDENGQPRTRQYRKGYRAVINLYNTMSETPSLLYNEAVRGYMRTSTHITLSIGAILGITRKGVMSDSESALDYWIEVEEPIILDI